MKLAAGLAAGVLGLAMAATPAAAGEGDVVVVGDSLTNQATPAIERELGERGWVHHVQGVNGSGLSAGNLANNPYDWVSRLAYLERVYDPKVVVVALGTNDALWVDAGEPYAPHISRLLAVTDAERVLWLDCSQHTAIPERNNGCALIREQLVADGRVEVVDYDAEVASDPTNGCCDSVHLSTKGANAFGELIGREVGPK